MAEVDILGMIGKPHWFKRRKYGGWGVFPKTWQGWVYIGVIIAPFFLIQYLPFGGDNMRTVLLFIWAAVLCIDFVHIFMSMPKDEREVIHEAFAERNAVWAMVAILAAGVAYQLASGAVANKIYVDPVIIVALVGGVLAKAATNIYLDRKN